MLGHVYLALDEQEKSYDYFRKAAWSSAYVSSAMTYAAMLDIRKLEYDKAVQHLTTAITYHKDNAVANALMIYASYLQGDKKASERQYLSVEANDKLNHLARYFGVLTGKVSARDFMEKIRTDKNQVCLDLIETLLVANLQKEAVSLIEMLQTHEPLILVCLPYMQI